MKKILFALVLFAVQACARTETVVWDEPEYNRLAAHVSVISKTSNYVIYEYRDIRVDELAPIAALYCQDQANKQAALYEITRHRNNARRATFVCKKTGEMYQ